MRIHRPLWQNAGIRALGVDALKLGVSVAVLGGVVYYGNDIARWILNSPVGDWISKKVSRSVG